VGRTDRFEDLKNLPVKSVYLNLYNFYSFIKNHSQTPNTPAVHLFYALEIALENILNEGVEINSHYYLEGASPAYGFKTRAEATCVVQSANTTTTHTYTSSGTYDVTVHMLTAQGCPSTVVGLGLASVYPNPIADFTTDPNPPVVTLINPTFDYLQNLHNST